MNLASGERGGGMRANDQDDSDKMSTDEKQDMDEDKEPTNGNSGSQRTVDPKLIYIRSRSGDRPKVGDRQDRDTTDK